MIEINLLPLELREKKKIITLSAFEGILKTKIIFIVFGCLIFVHLFLISLTVINTKRFNSLKKTWEGLSSKSEKIDQLKRTSSDINEKISLIEQLISNRVFWSEKLNRISNLMVSGIWLNELTLQKQKAKTEGGFPESLIIRGSAASRTKDEPALIGRFMQNLKDDPSFSADFIEIELGPIKKRLIKQTEVMDFILICRFKQERAEALLK